MKVGEIYKKISLILTLVTSRSLIFLIFLALLKSIFEQTRVQDLHQLN